MLRLDMSKTLKTVPPQVLAFTETGEGPEGQSGGIIVNPEALLNRVGDVVLARRDMGTSYHLSVVVDDAAQNVSHVIRGQDLLRQRGFTSHLPGFWAIQCRSIITID